jgi:hypothetical protein
LASFEPHFSVEFHEGFDFSPVLFLIDFLEFGQNDLLFSENFDGSFNGKLFFLVIDPKSAGGDFFAE